MRPKKNTYPKDLDPDPQHGEKEPQIIVIWLCMCISLGKLERGGGGGVVRLRRVCNYECLTEEPVSSGCTRQCNGDSKYTSHSLLWERRQMETCHVSFFNSICKH
jgi:hypothetical protein